MREDVKQMRTFIYKRTHNGDPDPVTGEFGVGNCMKGCRVWSFDAVIGVGGTGREPLRHGIARKLTWVGIGPHKTGNPRLPIVTFDHFLYYGDKGPLLENVAKSIAEHFYQGGARMLVNLSDEESLEAERILSSAMTAPPSPGRPNSTLLQTRACRPQLAGARRPLEAVCRAVRHQNCSCREDQ